MKMFRTILSITYLWAALAEEDGSPDYGVDISFPMHHREVSTNYPWLPHNVDPSLPVPPEYEGMPLQPLGDVKSRHDRYMEGCRKKYEKKAARCDSNEADRVTMSLRQPQSMVNYTQMGFAKIRAPDHVWALIQEFWQKNKDKSKAESWPVGNIYTNHWESPSRMVSVEDVSLEGAGYVLKQHIWNAARETISHWTGQQLAECSLYGIRVYPEGSMLATHVDRLPLVSSAIINVDQDVDEPWPLEVIGHDGRAHNVTMVPGDLVLYESHSVLHGRPFPLKGRFMANIFIHFEPVGAVGGQIEYDGDLPPYVIPGSPEEQNWRMQHPGGHSLVSQRSFETGSTEAHHAANVGDLVELRKLVNKNAEVVNTRDKNGWTPLHEAVRSGNLDLVRFLLERGADPNARTGKNGEGGNALWWVQHVHGSHPELVALLEEFDAAHDDTVRQDL